MLIIFSYVKIIYFFLFGYSKAVQLTGICSCACSDLFDYQFNAINVYLAKSTNKQYLFTICIYLS